MDPRENNLPKWAQEVISSLRLRLEANREPLLTELVRLRPRVELLEARNCALNELLQCAARGGHITAAEIVNIIENYDLTLTKKET